MSSLTKNFVGCFVLFIAWSMFPIMVLMGEPITNASPFILRAEWISSDEKSWRAARWMDCIFEMLINTQQSALLCSTKSPRIATGSSLAPIIVTMGLSWYRQSSTPHWYQLNNRYGYFDGGIHDDHGFELSHLT